MLAASAAAVLAFVAGCGSSGSSAGGSPAASTAPAPSTTAPATTPPSSSAAALKVATSGTLGQIVTDSSGHTLYRFDHDSASPPTSSCTGSCAATWQAAPAPGGQPTATGVSGQVGTLTRSDGTRQLTLNGWPLYRFSGDGAPGDTKGQGVAGIWWAVTPSGARAGSGGAASSPGSPTMPSSPATPTMPSTPAPSSPGTSSGGGGYNY
ncbi:hypothetical protein GCM10009665_24410 [Kitasatospora nipponensis]|uniref:Lipoprotein with Yx(FWY)xxD motif n=2 Tax=Kitasatospora nipponensis TaxID=258049 RepID=A0ABN1W3R1_9ACTN